MSYGPPQQNPQSRPPMSADQRLAYASWAGAGLGVLMFIWGFLDWYGQGSDGIGGYSPAGGGAATVVGLSLAAGIVAAVHALEKKFDSPLPAALAVASALVVVGVLIGKSSIGANGSVDADIGLILALITAIVQAAVLAYVWLTSSGRLAGSGASTQQGQQRSGHGPALRDPHDPAVSEPGGVPFAAAAAGAAGAYQEPFGDRSAYPPPPEPPARGGGAEADDLSRTSVFQSPWASGQHGESSTEGAGAAGTAPEPEQQKLPAEMRAELGDPSTAGGAASSTDQTSSFDRPSFDQPPFDRPSYDQSSFDRPYEPPTYSPPNPGYGPPQGQPQGAPQGPPQGPPWQGGPPPGPGWQGGPPQGPPSWQQGPSGPPPWQQDRPGDGGPSGAPWNTPQESSAPPSSPFAGQPGGPPHGSPYADPYGPPPAGPSSSPEGTQSAPEPGAPWQSDGQEGDAPPPWRTETPPVGEPEETPDPPQPDISQTMIIPRPGQPGHPEQGRHDGGEH